MALVGRLFGVPPLMFRKAVDKNIRVKSLPIDTKKKETWIISNISQAYKFYFCFQIIFLPFKTIQRRKCILQFPADQVTLIPQKQSDDKYVKGTALDFNIYMKGKVLPTHSSLRIVLDPERFGKFPL